MRVALEAGLPEHRVLLTEQQMLALRRYALGLALPGTRLLRTDLAEAMAVHPLEVRGPYGERCPLVGVWYGVPLYLDRCARPSRP